MATKRTYISSDGSVRTFNANRTYISSSGSVVSEQLLTAGGPTTTQISASFSATGGVTAIEDSTNFITAAMTATGTSSVTKNIKKFFSMTATGASSLAKTVFKTFSATATGTVTAQNALMTEESASFTATGTASSSEVFIAGVPTSNFLKGIIMKGIQMIGNLIKGVKI